MDKIEYDTSSHRILSIRKKMMKSLVNAGEYGKSQGCDTYMDLEFVIGDQLFGVGSEKKKSKAAVTFLVDFHKKMNLPFDV